MAAGGRIDPADHLRRPWRVHAIAAAEGLALHDVWEVATALPAGVPLARWVEALRTEPRSRPARALFAVRVALGRLLGLDRGGSGFVPVYQEPDEVLSRIANRTVTAFLHVSLAEGHPRLAVYVRPNGALGRGYMALIEPFRRWVVYPALLTAGARAAARLAGG
ncbi:MAG TPA: DUF2867 domain-containing protein [Methylomirabilota bacterium]|jgi:hypothetical protein|nr:DUF2867 domain-containing protein [Methylomirabilota bacterium]